MKILVTGGAGFLGRRIVAGALAAGHTAAVTSRRPESVRDLPPGVDAVGCDLRQRASLEAVLAAQRPDALVHAAAVIANDAPDLVAVNVDATALLCSVLAARGGTKLVFVSSFAAEDTPSTPYSESKLAAEEVVRASGVPAVVLRPTLIYGPGDAANTQTLVERMRSGSQWLPAGGRVRIQPVFVDDVAAAAVAAAERDVAVGRTYRLGGAEPVSVRAYREAVRDASGGRAAIRAIPLPLFALLARGLALAGKRGPLGVLAFHTSDHAVDSSAARTDLGFAPRGLAEGLGSTFPS
ncbi:MAG: NAD(P)-dependent oxidoreductase [Planctomycetes bacterium]|nr:NAD(P)-dependent oxidoreductase [Planctomycetota bacterium]